MKKWLKLLLVVVCFALISLVVFFVLKALGLTELKTLQALVKQAGSFGIIIFYLLETLLFALLCFVPVLEPTLTLIGLLLFGPKITFIVSWLAEISADTLMYFIGCKFGTTLALKLVSKEDMENAQTIVNAKSKVFLPLFFIVPGLPDDALSLVAGMSKIKFWYFALNSFLFCGIDSAIVCFLGCGLINWSALTIFDWVILINLVIVDIYLICKLQKFLETKAKQ